MFRKICFILWDKEVIRMSLYRYSQKALSAQAKELGFITNGLEKMLRLINVLQQLNRDPLLKGSLALKGGTAINLTIFNLPRLSHDIDFDYAIPLDREKTLASRGEVTGKLIELMEASGYELKPERSKKTHALDSFFFSYVNVGSGIEALKIEINYSLRAHVLPTIIRFVDLLDGSLGNLVIHSVHPIEIFASKIAALLSRASPRDLYDLNNMVYYGLFDESELLMLKKCVVFYNAIGGKESWLNPGRVRAITSYGTKTQLLSMLRKGDGFDLQAAKERVHGFLSELLRLGEGEKLFLQAFSRGDYRPELLFDEQGILERIRNHPMAIWKTKNLPGKSGNAGK